MQRAPLFLVAAGLLAASGTASAGDPESAAPADETAAPATTAPPGMWSTELNDRPLVTPIGKLDVQGALPFVPHTTGSTTALGVRFDVGGTYGVANKIEVGADYALSLKDFDATGTLTLRGAYLAMTAPKWDLALAAALIADLTSGGETSLNIGGWFRYRLGPKATLFTGMPALPPLVAGVAGFPRPPSPYQLTFGLDNGNRVALNLPIGIGYQATPNVYVYGSTTLAYLLFDATEQRFLFADVIPIGIGASYSPSGKLDIGVQLSDDLKYAGRSYVFMVTGRYYVK